jgi:hypothetical protein
MGAVAVVLTRMAVVRSAAAEAELGGFGAGRQQGEGDDGDGQKTDHAGLHCAA